MNCITMEDYTVLKNKLVDGYAEINNLYQYILNRSLFKLFNRDNELKYLNYVGLGYLRTVEELLK